MAQQTRIQCPQCGQPFTAIVDTIIDPATDPESKMRLLSGQVNNARCPNCGTPVNMAAPILYHDANKELLITFLPMELNLRKDQQEKAVGDLMRELTASLPKESMKGYFFNPKQALTLQGLIEMVLQADGITPEMMEQQRSRVKLIEGLLATPEEQLEGFIQQNDAQIDAQFMQTLTVMAQRMAQEGQSELVEHLLGLQQYLIAYSSYGKTLVEQNRVQQETVAAMADEINALGAEATREDFHKLAVKYAEDDHRLQALVGLARPAYDYEFFQELTEQINNATEGERAKLEALREKLMNLTAMVDQQSQMAVQEAVQLLQILASSPDPDALIRENLNAFDDTFMTVLTANIQESERQGNIQASAKLKDLYERVVTVLRANMDPALQLINELLGAETEADAHALIQAQAGPYGASLLDLVDRITELLSTRGDEASSAKLSNLRSEIERVVGGA